MLQDTAFSLANMTLPQGLAFFSFVIKPCVSGRQSTARGRSSRGYLASRFRRYARKSRRLIRSHCFRYLPSQKFEPNQLTRVCGPVATRLIVPS
jgi:hypothetical protein